MSNESFDLDAACNKTFSSDKDMISKAWDFLQRDFDWSNIPCDVRGHPVRRFKKLLESNNLGVLRPDQREQLRLEILAYGERLVEIDLLSRADFEDIASGQET